VTPLPHELLLASEALRRAQIELDALRKERTAMADALNVRNLAGNLESLPSFARDLHKSWENLRRDDLECRHVLGAGKAELTVEACRRVMAMRGDDRPTTSFLKGELNYGEMELVRLEHELLVTRTAAILGSLAMSATCWLWQLPKLAVAAVVVVGLLRLALRARATVRELRSIRATQRLAVQEGWVREAYTAFSSSKSASGGYRWTREVPR
jgi:hypothetical protein